ncbi:MAG: hypothetical protein ACRYFV_05130 [Janthinobacterium lividum]
MARNIHNRRAELFQLVQAGRIELASGKYAAARAHVVEAQRLIPAAHDLLGTGHVHSALGDISRQQSQWLAARCYYAKAAASYGKVYNKRGLLPIELSQVEMTDRLGDHLAARHAAYGLLRCAQSTGTSEQVAQATLLLAQTWLAASRPDSGRHYATLSLAAARPTHLCLQASDAAPVLVRPATSSGRATRPIVTRPWRVRMPIALPVRIPAAGWLLSKPRLPAANSKPRLGCCGSEPASRPKRWS